MMQKLAYQIQGKDLQLLQELRAALKKPAAGILMLKEEGRILYQLPDQSIWSFEEENIVTESKRRYVQVIATNLTKLYHLQRDIDKRNEELSEMIRQVQRITQDVAEVTRQQEILTAKMRVHNKMGNCLLAARQYLVQGFPKHKKASLIDIWQNSLDILQGEIEAEDERDALEEVIEIANSIGVNVVIQGDHPEYMKNGYLFVVALRECVTNTIQHAQGNQVTVTLHKKRDSATAVYTNNGKQPEKEIVFAGGLTSLKEKIEREGGIMEVGSKPRFILKVTLPE